MVIKQLYGKVVFLDTAPLIYYIEGNSMFTGLLESIFIANKFGELRFVTSTITLLEVLVLPIRLKRFNIVSAYQNILTGSKFISVIDATQNIAVHAATLRAECNLRTPDSIQIATYFDQRADYFLTNDIRLKNIQNLNCLLISDL